MKRGQHGILAPGLRLPVQGKVTKCAALDIIKPNAGHGLPVCVLPPLQSEHERCLTEEVFRQPVIVHDYPRDIKAGWEGQQQITRSVSSRCSVQAGIGRDSRSSHAAASQPVLNRSVTVAVGHCSLPAPQAF